MESVFAVLRISRAVHVTLPTHSQWSSLYDPRIFAIACRTALKLIRHSQQKQLIRDILPFLFSCLKIVFLRASPLLLPFSADIVMFVQKLHGLQSSSGEINILAELTWQLSLIPGAAHRDKLLSSVWCAIWGSALRLTSISGWHHETASLLIDAVGCENLPAFAPMLTVEKASISESNDESPMEHVMIWLYQLCVIGCRVLLDLRDAIKSDILHEQESRVGEETIQK